MKTHLLVTFFSAALTHNIVLTYFLGLCPFVTLSKTVRGAFGMGIAVTVVMVTTALTNQIIYHHLLVPQNITYMMFLVFILSIATIVQLIEMVVDRFFPFLYNAFGIFLPLITVNCSILGVSLFMIVKDLTVFEVFFFSLGSGIGWLVAIVAISSLKKRLAYTHPVSYLEDTGITLILAGLISLSFLGFSGIGL